jgi:hypothetical protein
MVLLLHKHDESCGTRSTHWRWIPTMDSSDEQRAEGSGVRHACGMECERGRGMVMGVKAQVVGAALKPRLNGGALCAKM